LVRQSADQALARIEAGAVKAVRNAAVSEVGAKIGSTIVGPMATIEEALRKLKSSAEHAETAWGQLTKRKKSYAKAVLRLESTCKALG
jgi:hypothetical protein